MEEGHEYLRRGRVSLSESGESITTHLVAPKRLEK